MRTIWICSLAVLVVHGLAGCKAETAPTEVSERSFADAVYVDGTVITMNDAQPLAAAVAIKDGRILAVGDKAQVLNAANENTQRINLDGRTLLPGFVDSHGHAFMIGLQASTANLLPAPDGTGNSVPAIQQLLREWTDAHPAAVDRVGWIVGFGYDDSQLAELRHPTRQDLDEVSRDLPIVIVHQSGHLGVGNSKALELAGITEDTPDPDGGVFQRESDGRTPNGVAEEYAFFLLLGTLAANFDDETNDLFVSAGTALAASYGFTTVQEGRAVGAGVDAMQRAADAGRLAIDLVAYPDILEVETIEPSGEYRGRFRIGGAKLTIDGSPQGKTAWLTTPYYIPPEGQPADYRGYAAVDAETVRAAVEKAYAQGMQLLVHANGDAAIDELITAVRQAQTRHPEAGDLRPVLIHGQTLREDQVDELKELGIFPSLFPMHTFYWGDWHRDSVLGPERAENISPTGWLMERDMIFGTHHDAPVALPDSMRVLSATVTRRTRSGDILGPQHRVPVQTALKAMTIWPAWQHSEEDHKGSIEPGKLADFVILSDNPLEIDESLIDDIKIIETIKEGVSVYQRSEAGAK